MTRLSAYSGVLLYLVTLPGCQQAIQAVMIDAPNKHRLIEPNDDLLQITLDWHGIDRHERVEIEQPETSIDLWMMDARSKAGEVVEPKGSLIMLHGFRNDKVRMVDFARHFSAAGYRCFLVDLRGHGRSAGKYITYGVQESKDMVEVINHLEQQGLIIGKLGVWGISMGASTAIQLAARDQRVETVVAVAPYLSLRAVVPSLTRVALPFTRWTMSDDSIQKIVDHAGEVAGFDPDEADTLKAIKQTDIPILLVHGKWDAVCPPEHSRTLQATDPERIDLVEAPYVGHLTAHFHQTWRKRANELCWLDEHLAE